MALFFIDTDSGHVATHPQLVAAGLSPAAGLPPRPWLRIQGTGDATTMWFAVMRKREKGIFIGTLVFRHAPHHSLLLEQGWEEVPYTEISAPAPSETAG